MAEFPFVRKDAALFAYVDGLNAAPFYLGCFNVGEISQDTGETTFIRCRGETLRALVGQKEDGSTTLGWRYSDVINAIEKLPESAVIGLAINFFKAGRPELFSNAVRRVIIPNATVGIPNISDSATYDDDQANEEITREVDINFDQFLEPIQLTWSRISGATANNFLAGVMRSNKVGYAALSSTVGAASIIRKTVNGTTWAAAAAAPFAVAEDVVNLAVLERTSTVNRIVAVRGTAVTGQPPKVGYSDDDGATWTLANIGATNNLAIAGNAFHAMPDGKMWVGLANGYIYYSADAGVTWTAQEAGVIHAAAYNGIHFADASNGFAGGAAGVLAKTNDGGASWGVVTGPIATAVSKVWMKSKDEIFVAYSNGTLYTTKDAGITWTQRDFSGSGTGSIRDLRFTANGAIGYMIHHNTTSKVIGTPDGGYTWEEQTGIPTNSGFRMLSLIDYRNVWAFGDLNGGISLIGYGKP